MKIWPAEGATHMSRAAFPHRIRTGKVPVEYTAAKDVIKKSSLKKEAHCFTLHRMPPN